MNIIQFLAKSRGMMYRPELNPITGSIEATILLLQTCYWFDLSEGKPFYKFKEPCNHEAYKKSDSWCEELGMTAEVFDTAINLIGFKRGTSPKNQKAKLENEAIIIYWTDNQRFTWYTVNYTLLRELLNTVYLLYTETTTNIITDTGNGKVSSKEELQATKKVPTVTETIPTPLPIFLEEFNKAFSTQYRETDKRKTFLNKRLKRYSLTEILSAVKKMASNKFYQGENDRAWSANPDFILRSDEQIDRFLNMKEKDKYSITT